MRTESFLLGPSSWVPNNERLPVILHHAVAEGDRETVADVFEEMFGRNGWPAEWRDGVFGYHHYHSTTHEVLGVADGSATLVLGGPGDRSVDVDAGDVLILPAGVGHCCLDADDRFLVVGGYPDGQTWDICRTAPSPEARIRMATLPVPSSDPVIGRVGGVARLWRTDAE